MFRVALGFGRTSNLAPEVFAPGASAGRVRYNAQVRNFLGEAVHRVAKLVPRKLVGFGANHHLRQTLAFLNVPTLQAPEAYVGGIGDAFDANGELVKDALKQFATSDQSRQRV